MPRNGSLRLGSIRGVDIRVHWSWMLIVVWLVWVLADASGPIGRAFPSRGSPAWVPAAVTVLLFFGCVILHELAHAIMARHYGVEVPSITLFAFGGVASVATDMRRARDEFVVAVVGPLTSWALAAVFGVLWLALGGGGSLGALALVGATGASGAATIIGYLGVTNAALGLFNLLPGFPLDGGRVLRAAIWGQSQDIVLATRVAARSGSVVAYGFIVLGFACLLGRSAFAGIDLFALGLWNLWIGFFLRTATRRSYRELMSELMLRDTTAAGMMRPPPEPVQATMSVQQLVDTRIVPTEERAFLVWRGNAVAGMLTLTDIIRLARQRWPSTELAEAMVPVERLVTVAPETELTTAVRLMQERNVAHLPVLDGGRLVGLLALADVERQVETRIRSAEIERLRRAS
jgi:Zn-dependent protease